MIVGFVVAIAAAGETEQPSVIIALGNHGNSLSGTAKVGDLGSRGRLDVFVDGLVEGKNTETFQNTPSNPVYETKMVLYKAFVGPNGNGDASDNVTIPIPPHRFDAIALIAYTTKASRGCDPRQGKEVGTGCAVIRLPGRAGS